MLYVYLCFRYEKSEFLVLRFKNFFLFLWLCCFRGECADAGDVGGEGERW